MKRNVVRVDFERIREHAKANRWTGGMIARQAGIAPATVHFIFDGKIKDPGAATLKKICDVIGLPIEDAFIRTKRAAA